MPWALRDICAGALRVSLWTRLALTDIEILYKRSLFGMMWVTFSFAMFIFVKILVFGSITSVDNDFFAVWLSVGFWLWVLIQSIVVDSSKAFLTARGWILGTDLPLSIFAFQTLTRALIRFSFSLPVIVALLFALDWAPNVNWLWSLLGFLLIVINSVWVAILLAALCSRYNDIIHLVQAVMQVAFFLTPILYVPEQLGDKAYLLNFNPFTHYLAIVRDPIVGNGFTVLSWQVVGVMTIVGWIAALIIYQLMGRKVPFYVS